MKKSKLKKGEIDVEKCTMVSLIPARGGSKRIPRKNIKMLAGKPMLAWTIEASLKSKYIDRTFVTTEDAEIKKIALQYGAEVIDRPEEYASDTVPRRKYEIDGIVHNFKENLWNMGCKPEYLAFLYPTYPLRTGEQIDRAFELMIERNCTRIMTAYKMHFEREQIYYTMDKKGKAEFISDCWESPLYQHKELYLRALGAEFREPRYTGTAYIVIMRYGNINLDTDINYGDFTLYVIDEADAVDVDTPLDFKVAEMLLEERIKGKVKNEEFGISKKLK